MAGTSRFSPDGFDDSALARAPGNVSAQSGPETEQKPPLLRRRFDPGIHTAGHPVS